MASAVVKPDIKPKDATEHKTLAEALSAAQAEFKTVVKGSVNPHFKSKYATLPDFLAATRPSLAKHGLVVTQAVGYHTPSATVLLLTILKHPASGEFLPSQYPVIPGKAADPQALGSALTYARRYAYATIVGAVAEDDDDDGNKGSKPETQQYGETRDEISRVASELEQKGGKTPEAWIKYCSTFTKDPTPEEAQKGAKPRTVQGFSDPYDPSVKSEKWLRSTLSKLVAELEKLEPGAAEAAELMK